MPERDAQAPFLLEKNYSYPERSLATEDCIGLSNGQIKQLVMKSQTGCGESLGQLWDHFQPRVFRYALSRVENHHQAEDIAGSVAEKLVKYIGSYEDVGAPFDAYLMRIAKNAVIDSVRKSKDTLDIDAHREIVDISPRNDPQRSEEANEINNRIRKALLKLNPTQRMVVEGKLLRGLDYSELSADLGISPANLRVHMSRGLSKIRKDLADIKPSRKKTEGAA